MDTKNFDVSPYVNSIKDTLAKILHVNDAAQDEIKNLRDELNRTKISLQNEQKHRQQLEISLQNTNAKLNNTAAQLDDTTRELSNTKSRLNNTAAQLDDTTHRLDDTTRELSNTMSRLNNTAAQLDDTTHRLDDTTRELSNTKSRLNDATAQIEDYAEKYADIEQAYNSYKKLSDTTKFSLEGIFGAANSPTNFLIGALQERHLDNLFDYVTNTINSGTNPAEIDILHGLFEFVFNAANSGRREKIFTRLNVSAGDIFDDEEMRKTSSSAQSGTVQKVLLAGYKFSRTGKIVKPSLVAIG